LLYGHAADNVRRLRGDLASQPAWHSADLEASTAPNKFRRELSKLAFANPAAKDWRATSFGRSLGLPNDEVDTLVTEAMEHARKMGYYRLKEAPPPEEPGGRAASWIADPDTPDEWHHFYPVEHEKYFRDQGIDIDLPPFGRYLNRAIHKFVHGKDTTLDQAWNADWNEWIEKHPTARLDIEDQMKRLRSKYGI